MEAAIGGASWLVGKVLNKLSDDLVAAYVASSELGLNSEQIKTKLKYMQGLLHAAQDRDVSSNPGLQSLLEDLSKKADEAEDLLDELHYFMIRDQLDGTHEATPELGGGLSGKAIHGRHAARHTFGNWLPCFSCSSTQDDDSSAAAAATVVASNPHNATKSDSTDGMLTFDRVAMSNKIKSVIEDIHNLCDPVSDLLNKIPNSSTRVSLKRPLTGSTFVQNKLYGRSVIFEKTVNALTSGTYDSQTLSVLPFVGPGGMGKTTFTQHLYNDERIEGHFTVKVWVCVSTDFDVLKLTRQILSCIPAAEKEENINISEMTNLDQLQKCIAERLKSKSFLVVLDDIWKCGSEGDWKNLLSPLTKGETKGNIVLVTTRFPSVAEMVKTTDPIELHGLEPDDFFAFFEACIFGDSKLTQHYKDELIDVARAIAIKLKGSPLAAKTVGRLLKKNLSRDYWMDILEKNEWQNSKNDDDIMPSLRISYDYLPFLLKKCFSYCALFPEDHRFYDSEIACFWVAIGIIDSSHKNCKTYLEELVSNGFLMKGYDKGQQYYVMHDLLHELSRNVSSQECVNISSLSFRAEDISQSIQHLSITLEDKYDESFGEELGKLKSVIDIVNLRTLMVFGSHDSRIDNILKHTFQNAKCLRVLFISMNTQESLPNSFSKFIHLRYLKISSSPLLKDSVTLPSTLSRFYHLKFLDLNSWFGSEKLPKDISRLVNLCHFHSSKELHSSIPEVGKLKCLQELKEFIVKKESAGFELRELGEMRELGGELSICNLETVATKGEASGAKLKNKRNLKELRLVWAAEHQNIDDDVLDGFNPPDNLRVLGVVNPGVAPCPSWLCGDISKKRLESLYLESVSWETLPPFEQLQHLTELSLKNIAGMHKFGPGFGGVTERSFMHLKKIEFEDMPRLVEWVGASDSHCFTRLESIRCINCPHLSSFPFLKFAGRFTRLCNLQVFGCPTLDEMPPLPHTSMLTNVYVVDSRSKLGYDGKRLRIESYTNDLVFHNMDKLEVVSITGVSDISLSDLKSMKLLRSLIVSECENIFSAELDDSVVCPSVQNLSLYNLCITRELFSKLLKCFPALSQLTICSCRNLDLLPVEYGALRGIPMLQSLEILISNVLSQWPKEEIEGGTHTIIKPFPTSLRELVIYSESGLTSMSLLSNLTSLSSLRLDSCSALKMDGFNPLITVNLKKLVINECQKEGNISIAGDLLSEIARSKVMHPGSFQLEEFKVDSISAVLVVSICSHLGASLHTLEFRDDQLMETFTEEQEQALQLLTSLQDLKFWYCTNLQSLPQGLHRLPSLRRLEINGCKKIQSLPPKEGLPTSLETLEVVSCGPELTEQAEKLRAADPYFSALISVIN